MSVIADSNFPTASTFQSESAEIASNPSSFLQFNWVQPPSFEDMDHSFDFLSHSDNVNIQLQRLMDMTFLSPIGPGFAQTPQSTASPRVGPCPAAFGANMMGAAPVVFNPLWKTLEATKWTEMIEQVTEPEQAGFINW
jgi:hypothetical protein